MPLTNFHPAVARWFEREFAAPTPVQTQAWPAIAGGRHTLIAAPTGSGKTLAAFLAAIDALVRESQAGPLPDETRVLYVSPLKALSNDIHRNLEVPLAGIGAELEATGRDSATIRAWVRTGDTPASERARMRKRPPHVLVTTPESLFILLTSESGRQMLKSVRTVIVDEIHALAGNKRGSHLALSLERLATLCREHGGAAPTRVGISATQKPIDDMARFLTGGVQCMVVDIGHVRERDLAIEVPGSPLGAVMSAETWEEVYDRLAELIEAHRTTLIFVNTRRLAERAAHRLAERLGTEHVTAHHGSLAREHRLDAEQRLKAGRLRALVATASLELGIDIGEVDLVCQIGSPRAIATLLQRVGRSGHAVGGTPKGRLFPLSRDDLVECTALLDAVRRDELDRIRIPQAPLDVLAQQVVAEVASRDWDEAALYDMFRQAWPYRDLARGDYTAVVRMLSEGYTTRRGRRGAYVHRDAVHGMLRGRRGARHVAVTNGGAIPDLFDYDVVLQPEGLFIGSLNEDFAFESLPGDIFQLGNTSYRILRVEKGKVHVEDAHGQPPNIPFWFGEAPGRTEELSTAVSRLRQAVAKHLDTGIDAAAHWLEQTLGLPPGAARQLVDYLAAAKIALGAVPTQDTVVFERFFDQTGDMHFVIHAPFGSRINRAWGLALRKRFCRKFNFELQAAATEDNIVLSLGPTHSFPLAEVAGYLKPASVREILIQALLAAPLFGTRWRWVANTALAVPRNRHGKRVPAQFQRSDAEDLIAVVFPDQLACVENIAGDREIPDHPLVKQTLDDCLHDAMDIDGLERLLQRLADGSLTVITRDLPTPSPLAQEILNARPYAFLDDGAAEERRALNVQRRPVPAPQSAAELCTLNPEAIRRVQAEAWPEAGSADELHDALMLLGFLSDAEAARGPGGAPLLEALARNGRAARFTTSGGASVWAAAERLAQLAAAFPDGTWTPAIKPHVEANAPTFDAETALVDLLRSRLEALGPVTPDELATPLGLSGPNIAAALATLEQEGYVIQGQFTGRVGIEWCERGLLARIHRYTLRQLRAEVEPVSPADYMRFLFRWQRLGEERGEGVEALAAVLAQLEGFSVPAAAWESEVLPARLALYSPDLLDHLCTTGRVVWLRLHVPAAPDTTPRRNAPVRITPIAFVARAHARLWRALAAPAASEGLTSSAQRVAEILQREGASFFDDLRATTGLLPTQLEETLGELVARGLITADSYAGLRALITPAQLARRRRPTAPGIAAAGRWSLLPQAGDENSRDSTEHVARVLLTRYGVVFRRALDRESGLPPWRDLLYVYRRLEARGEIRGGRFVQQFSGEQYALPAAVDALRALRKQPPNGELVSISAADPVNLTGIITPGARVPAQASNRILFRDGAPVAVSIAGKIEYLAEFDAAAQWSLRARLLRKQHALFAHPPEHLAT